MCPECTSPEGKILIFFIFKSGQGIVARRRHVTSCQLMRPKQGKAMHQRPLLYLYKIVFNHFHLCDTNKEGRWGSWVSDQDKEVLLTSSTKMKINLIQTSPSCVLMAQRGPRWNAQDDAGANGHWSLPWRTVYENSMGWPMKALVGGKDHTAPFLYWESFGFSYLIPVSNKPTLLPISPSERNRLTTALNHVTHTHPTQVVG